MSTIDERVVQMQFDNRQFESNVKTSLTTLDRLKQALNFGKSTQDLQDLQNAGNRFNLSGIGDAVESVQLKFSAFEVMAMRVLTNIADSAYNAGTRLVKSLSVDQITSGWSKFEDKTKSVQTIMNATGLSVDEVNEQLEKLNWFTDETSYNFTDMVSNIGKFTAVNVPLNDAVTAMEGIANVAAISGQGVGEASRAMYNFAQAMAVGNVKLMDWRSIENANMATTEFKQTIIDTAVEMKTLTKTADGYKTVAKGSAVSAQNFNEALSEGWFTSDVLVATLKKYGSYTDQIYEMSDAYDTCADAMKAFDATMDTGDKVLDLGKRAFKAAQEAKTFTDAIDATKDAVSTGWMTTFEILIGNYEEAKELWTDLANALWDVFASGSEVRNEMLKGWKELGGRTSLINSFWNAWEGVANIVNIAKDAFRDIFPRMESSKLFEITKNIETLTQRFKSLFSISESVQKALEKGIVPDEEAEKIKKVQDRIENLYKAFNGLFAIVDIGKRALGAIWELVKVFLRSIFPLGDGILGVAGSFGDWLASMQAAIIENETFEKIVEKLTPIVEGFGSVIKWVFDALKDALDKVRGLFRPVTEEADEFGEVVEKRWSPIGKIIEIVSKAFDRLKEVFKGLKPLIEAVGKGLGNAWDQIHNNIMDTLSNTNFDSTMDILNGGILAALGIGLINLITRIKNMIPPEGFKSIKDNITELFNSIKESILPISKEPSMGDDLLKVAGAIAILAGSLVFLSTVDSSKLMSSVVAIGALAAILGALMKALSGLTTSSKTKTSAKGGFLGSIFGIFSQKGTEKSDILKMSAALLVVSIALGVLTGSLVKLSQVNFSSMVKGLIGVGALLAMLVIVAKSLSNMDKKIAKGATTLILMSVALRILTGAVEKLGVMDSEQLLNGVLAVGALIAALALFSKFSDKIKVGTGLALIEIGAALLIISKAAETFGKMDTLTLSGGLSSIAAILGTFVVFTHTVKPKGILKTAAAMVIMSAALAIIGKVVKSIGSLTDEQVGRGLSTLAGGLLGLALAANFMKGTIGGSLSMLVMATALLGLAASLKIISTIKVEDLTKALIGLAATLTILGIAAAVLTPMAGGVFLVAGALLAIGVSILAAGAGVTALAAGITALSVSLKVALPMIVESIVAFIAALLDGINVLIPKVVEVALNIIISLIETLSANASRLIIAGVTLILNLINGISIMIPLIIDTAIKLMVNFINGLAQGIRDNTETLLSAVGSLIEAVLEFFITGIQKILELIPFVGDKISSKLDDAKEALRETFGVDAMEEITEGGMEGAAKGIRNSQADVQSATESLSTSGIIGLDSIVGEFREIGDGQVAEYLDSILGNTDNAKDASSQLSDATIEGADEQGLHAEMKRIGSYAGEGMNNGLAEWGATVYTTAYNTASNITRASRDALSVQSPSKEMIEIGQYSGEGLAIGLSNLAGRIYDTASDLGGKAIDGVKNAVNNIYDLLNSDLEAVPTITPVLDLTNLQNGANSINSMFSSQTMRLAGINDSLFDRNQLAYSAQLEALNSNADVVSAITDLRYDVNQLNNAMSSMQVVMDSGQLVGSIARGMDSALGRINTYKGRGI